MLRKRLREKDLSRLGDFGLGQSLNEFENTGITPVMERSCESSRPMQHFETTSLGGSAGYHRQKSGRERIFIGVSLNVHENKLVIF